MDEGLNRLFDTLNRRYWRGRLPKYRVIRRRKMQDLGLCNNGTRTILISHEQSEEQARLTLLHEMCHIGSNTFTKHGKRFLRKLERLVRLGETALRAEDIERYDGTEANRMVQALQARGICGIHIQDARSTIREDLQSMSFEPQVRRKRWATIRRWLAGDGMSPAAFDRYAPWARREWLRLVREAREEERFRAQRERAKERGDNQP